MDTSIEKCIKKDLQGQSDILTAIVTCYSEEGVSPILLANYKAAIRKINAACNLLEADQEEFDK